MCTLPDLKTNLILSALFQKKAEDAVSYRGYIGHVQGEEYILLYEDIFDLSKSLEIKRSDIVLATEAPRSLLPYDGVIVWLKRDSNVVTRYTGKSEASLSKDIIKVINKETVQISSGRLTMTVAVHPVPVQPCGRPIHPVIGITISDES